MKAILVEDEQFAAENLTFLLNSIAPDLQIVECIETVSEAITYFKADHDYDLVFMDIHLADGNSFEILQSIEPKAPIIFTTAYDQYAIQAFKVNSIDYLLKPIRESELQKAIEKFKNQQQEVPFSADQIRALMGLMKGPAKTYRQSFLVQRKDTFIPIKALDFAYFFIQNGVVRGKTKDQTIYSFNEKLEDLERDLDPNLFFRVNRQYLIQRAAIQALQSYFNGRLLVQIQPAIDEQIIVSKANASKLKAWLNGA